MAWISNYVSKISTNKQLFVDLAAIAVLNWQNITPFIIFLHLF